MSAHFGTWADRDYGQIPAGEKGLRAVYHAQRLIQAKYGNPTKCPKAEADIFHYQAVELVRLEDEDASNALPLLLEAV